MHRARQSCLVVGVHPEVYADADASHIGTRRSHVVVSGQDHPLPVTLPRARRRLSPAVRESKDRQVRICASLLERMGARHLRKTAHQVCCLFSSSVPSSDRRRYPLALVRPGLRRSAICRGRVSNAPGRDVLLLGGRLRQGGMARGCCGVPRRLSTQAPLSRARTITVRARRARLALLRGSHFSGIGATTRGTPSHRNDGGTPGHRTGFVRPSISESGHDAAGRVRKSDRVALAEGLTRPGPQRLPR